MKKFRITIVYEDAIEAKNKEKATEKLIWKILPNIAWEEFFKVEECSDKKYKQFNR